MSNETGGTLSPPLQAGCLPAPSLSRVTRPEQVGSALEPSVNAARLLAGYRCAGSQRVQFQAAEASVQGPVTSRLAPMAMLALPSQKGSFAPHAPLT